MPVLKKPYPYQPKKSLIPKFINRINDVPEEVEHDVARLFHIQKLYYLLNKTDLDALLFRWINEAPAEPQSWLGLLKNYGIDADASLFLNGIQFADAIAQKISAPPTLEENDIYKLMQQRNTLLENNEELTDEFIALSCRISFLAKTNEVYKTIVKRHQEILSVCQEKISAIKGHDKIKYHQYSTKPLSDHRVNNYNFKFKIKGQPHRFVIRVEDRPNLGCDQLLVTDPNVSEYLTDDAAIFRMQFIEDDGDIIYMPVILSQFAAQGDLQNVAQKLNQAPLKDSIAKAQYYFAQISDFCLALKKIGVFHPDIKLSNFLVHDDKILISDRKTFVTEPKPLASTVRSTPSFAPPEYTNCLDEKQKNYTKQAQSTYLDIEQLMSYEIGMALKEFLTLAGVKTIEDDFWNPSHNLSFLLSHRHNEVSGDVLTNLSLLIRELVDASVGKRLTIEQFQQLLPEVNKSFEQFYAKLEEVAPSQALGIVNELQTIKKLLAAKEMNDQDLLNESFVILNQLPHVARLNWFGEELAIHCYKACSQNYTQNLIKQLKQELFEENWNKAPWYRKVLHVLTFGYIPVARTATIDTLTTKIDLQSPELQKHFAILKYIPAAYYKEFKISSILQEFLLKFFQKSAPTSEERTIASPKIEKNQTHISPAQTPTDECESVDSGTMVYNKTKIEPCSPTGNPDSTDSGSTVFHKKAKTSEDHKLESELPNITIDSLQSTEIQDTEKQEENEKEKSTANRGARFFQDEAKASRRPVRRHLSLRGVHSSLMIRGEPDKKEQEPSETLTLKP